jgi:tight adherence protein B
MEALQTPILLLSVFAFVALSIMGLFFLFFPSEGRRDALFRMRLENLATIGMNAPGRDAGKDSVFRHPFLQNSWAQRILGLSVPALTDIVSRLEQAGLKIRARHFVELWITFFVLGGVVGWGYSTTKIGFVIGAGIGGLLPYLFLVQKTRMRRKAFENQFPETLRFLATSLKAGHALPASIRMLGEELPPPACEEFQKVAEESNLGLNIEEALKNLLHRMENPDLHFFVTAVMIQRETGGNLAELLEQLDSLIRERFKIRRQIKAITAPGRMTGILLGFLPIGVGAAFSVLNPTYMAPLWETELGRYMLYGVFVLQVAGYLVIRKIVNIRI